MSRSSAYDLEACRPLGTVFRDGPRLPETVVVLGPRQAPLAVGRFEVTFDEWQRCHDDGFCRAVLGMAYYGFRNDLSCNDRWGVGSRSHQPRKARNTMRKPATSSSAERFSDNPIGKITKATLESKAEAVRNLAEYEATEAAIKAKRDA